MQRPQHHSTKKLQKDYTKARQMSCNPASKILHFPMHVEGIDVCLNLYHVRQRMTYASSPTILGV